MSLRARLQRLQSRPEARRCPECGFLPDGLGYIVYDRRPEGSEEFCPRCGRRVWFVIEVSEAGGEGGDTYWLNVPV